MYISTTDIQTTLDKQLQTVADLPKLYEENDGPVAQGINPYCRSTLSSAKTTVLSLGNSPIMNQTGLYQVDLFYPTSYGYKPGRTVADAVIAAFPSSQLVLPDNTSILLITSAWSIPGNSVLKGSFWMVPIRVEWFINA